MLQCGTSISDAPAITIKNINCNSCITHCLWRVLLLEFSMARTAAARSLTNSKSICIPRSTCVVFIAYDIVNLHVRCEVSAVVRVMAVINWSQMSRVRGCRKQPLVGEVAYEKHERGACAMCSTCMTYAVV